MGKFLVRITVIGVALFFLITFVVGIVTNQNLFSNFYIVFFELITVVYCFSVGKYHCKFLKYTALAIFLSDTITRLDYAFNFLDAATHNVIPVVLMIVGLATTTTQAIIHFHKVNKLKRKRNEHQRSIANKENGIESN